MKHLLAVTLFLCSVSVSAQDVIVKKDGSTILSKVLEVNIADIKYKKFSNPNGPTYTIGKSEIMSINYENGEKDDFKSDEKLEVPHSNTQNSDPTFVEAMISDNNAATISLYNQDNHYIQNQAVPQTKKEFKKIKKEFEENRTDVFFINISENSVLSNEDLEISLVKEGDDKEWGSIKGIVLIFKNKTNTNLYIDLGSSFCVYQNGTYVPYYKNIVTTNYNLNTDTKGSGLSGNINLGNLAGVLGVGGIVGQLASGIGIGASSQKSNSVTRGSETTIYEDRVIIIPPLARKQIKAYYSFTHNFVFSGYEIYGPDYFEKIHLDDLTPYYYLIFNNRVSRKHLGNGEEMKFSETNSPDCRKYLFTYSHTPDFSSYSTISFQAYISKVIRVFGKYFDIDDIINQHNTLPEIISNCNKYTIFQTIRSEKGDDSF